MMILKNFCHYGSKRNEKNEYTDITAIMQTFTLWMWYSLLRRSRKNTHIFLFVCFDGDASLFKPPIDRTATYREKTFHYNILFTVSVNRN